MKLIQIGCGHNPLSGFQNYDSDLFLFFKYIPFSEKILSLFNFIPKAFIDFIILAKKHNIHYCDASKKIPLDDNSVELIYSCHMVEHLDWNESLSFFSESKRVLKNGGILRIVVPDFDFLINNYKKNNDVDRFIFQSYLVGDKPKNSLKKIQYFLQGHGWHHQMFTSKSIEKFQKLKFSQVIQVNPGITKFNFETSMNLFEREDGSLFFEFIK